ncbi:hypothetical protein [Marinobacter alkaliphilus]|uniref:Phage tail tape measure protein n=1 Tax=Marinobacter alkaliphilus TaxID=254719 RepID=A0ABZ3E6K6_9GAMM
MAKNLDLQVVLAARDKLTKPLKKIDATTTGTARALKQAQAETKQLQSSQRDISSFRRMDDALGKNAKALAESQERVRRLGHELRTTSKPTAKLRNEYNKARQEVEKFTRKGQDQRKELGKARKRLTDAGVDVRNLSGEQRRLADQMQATNNRIQRQRKYLDQLGKADISGKFSNMTGEVGRFGRRTAMLGIGASASIFGIANSTANLGDEAAKTADKLNMTVGSYQEMIYAGERSGIAKGEMASNMRRFVKRSGEAARGSGAAQQAFDALGLSAKELSSLPVDERLAIISDRLNSVASHDQKVDIASQLFGSSGGASMLNLLKDGSAGLQALRKDARATGYVLSEQAARDAEAFKDAMLDAQLGMAGMKNTIGAELMPAITDMMGDLSAWMRENRDQVSAFASNFGTKLKNAIPVLRDIAVGAASTAKTLGLIATNLATLVGGFDNLGMILAVVLAMKPIMAILAFGKAIFMATGAVVGLAGGLPAVAAGIKAIGVALTANPIGLIIAAIAGAGYLIYKNWGAIMDFFKSLPAKFSGFGSMIMDGLVGGLLGGLDKVKETIVNAGQKTIGWFKGVLGIKSPSRVFMSAGQDTLEGYRKGIQKQEPAALKQVSGFGKRVRSVGAGIAIGASALPAAAGVQFDNRPPIATGTPAAATAGDKVTINVYAAPGQNEREIAAQVERILQERDRRKATRARSALYDRE